jgi:hypothetical protein
MTARDKSKILQDGISIRYLRNLQGGYPKPLHIGKMLLPSSLKHLHEVANNLKFQQQAVQ